MIFVIIFAWSYWCDHISVIIFLWSCFLWSYLRDHLFVIIFLWSYWCDHIDVVILCEYPGICLSDICEEKRNWILVSRLTMFPAHSHVSDTQRRLKCILRLHWPKRGYGECDTGYDDEHCWWSFNCDDQSSANLIFVICTFHWEFHFIWHFCCIGYLGWWILYFGWWW